MISFAGMIIGNSRDVATVTAVRLQVVVRFMLLAAVSRTATLVSLLAPGRLFTPQLQLRRLGSGA